MDLPAPDLDIVTNENHLTQYLLMQKQLMMDNQRIEHILTKRDVSFGAPLIDLTHGTREEPGTIKNYLIANLSRAEAKNLNTKA